MQPSCPSRVFFFCMLILFVLMYINFICVQLFQHKRLAYKQEIYYKLGYSKLKLDVKEMLVFLGITLLTSCFAIGVLHLYLGDSTQISISLYCMYGVVFVLLQGIAYLISLLLFRLGGMRND